MRFMPRAILAGGAGFAVSLLAACGGGQNGLLSGGESSSLQSQLDQLSSAVASGDCLRADRASGALAQTAVNLPASVNVTVRQDLVQGAHTVAVLAQRDCSRTSPTSSTTSPTTSSTSSSTTTTTTSTPTTRSTSTTTSTTTTPTTTSTTSTPTTPTTPTTPSGGGGLGGAVGGGKHG